MTIPTTDASMPVRIPADVEREDRVLAGLTARQLAILTGTGLLLYAGYAATRTLLPPAVFLALAAPLAVGATTLALGSRDGLSLDRLAVAALRQRLSPRLQIPAADGVTAPPGWVTANATFADHPGNGRTRPGDLQLPARTVTDAGVIDLGPDGMAVLAIASTVNFALQTATEQQAVIAAFGRYLHSLTAPVQILIRTVPLDLSPQINTLREQAAGLPHPALEAAAREHADFLDQLSQHSELLHRQVLLVLREPAAPPPTGGVTRLLSPFTRPRHQDTPRTSRAAETRLSTRLAETIGLLSSAGIRITPLDAGQAAAVLSAACNPDRLIPATASMAGADDIITAAADAAGAQPEWPAAATNRDTATDADDMWWAR